MLQSREFISISYFIRIGLSLQMNYQCSISDAISTNSTLKTRFELRLLSSFNHVTYNSALKKIFPN